MRENLANTLHDWCVRFCGRVHTICVNLRVDASPLEFSRFCCPRSGRDLSAKSPRHCPAYWPWPCPVRIRVRSQSKPASSLRPRPQFVRGRAQPTFVTCPQICPCPVRDLTMTAICPRPVRGRKLSGVISLHVRNDNRAPRQVKLIATCGPLDIDDPQPAITVMMPDED